MVTMEWLWILMACMTVEIQTQSTFFPVVPGEEVFAIQNEPVTLQWRSDVDNVVWCYWEEVKDCEGDEICPVDEFLGYQPGKNVRFNISDGHLGWVFTNPKSPCQGGLRREKSDRDGFYQMVIEIHNGSKVMSGFSSLKSYAEEKLKVSVKINNMTNMANLQDGRDGPVELPAFVPGSWETRLTVTIVTDGIPPGTTLMVSKSSKTSGGFTQVCVDVCSFEVILGEEEGVKVSTDVHTQIQNYPSNTIVQAIETDDLSASNTSSPNFVISVTMAVVFGLISLVLAVYIGVTTWSRKKSTTPRRDEEDCSQLQATEMLIMKDGPEEVEKLEKTVTINENNDAICELRKSLEMCENELDEKNKIIQEQNESRRELQENLDLMKDREDKLKKQLVRQRAVDLWKHIAKIGMMKRDISAVWEEKVTLQAEKVTLQAEKVTLQAERDTVEAQKDTVEAQFKDVREKEKNWWKEKHNLEKEIDDLKKKGKFSAPQFNQTPPNISYPSDDSSARVSVAISGYPRPSVTWSLKRRWTGMADMAARPLSPLHKEIKPHDFQNSVRFEEDGNTYTMVIDRVKDFTGNYRIEASNKYGKDYREFQLNVDQCEASQQPTKDHTAHQGQLSDEASTSESEKSNTKVNTEPDANNIMDEINRPMP